MSQEILPGSENFRTITAGFGDVIVVGKRGQLNLVVQTSPNGIEGFVIEKSRKGYKIIGSLFNKGGLGKNEIVEVIDRIDFDTIVEMTRQISPKNAPNLWLTYAYKYLEEWSETTQPVTFTIDL